MTSSISLPGGQGGGEGGLPRPGPNLKQEGNTPMTSLYAPEVKSACGVANLLAAIFAEEPAKVKRRLGLPILSRQSVCPNCGEPAIRLSGLPATNPEGLCSKCWRESNYILVACSHCGALKKRLASLVVYLTSHRGYQHFFCNRHCLGKWAGEHYGFKVHNKPAKRGPHKRKWDYDMVWQKHLETGWGTYRLSRLLNIPRASVGHILSRERKAMKAEGGAGCLC